MKSVNFCEEGVLKTCSEANNPDVQKLCEFYDKSMSSNKCSWLRFEEFCTCIQIQKPVVEEEVEQDLAEDKPVEEVHKQKQLPFIGR